MGAAFKIGDEEFPLPETFTLADGPLVYEASGMEFDEFAECLDDEGPGSSRAMAGLVAIAVSRARPHWNRRRVVQFLANVDLDSFAIDGGDAVDPPAVPPETAAAKLSPSSSTESTISAGDTLGAPV